MPQTMNSAATAIERCAFIAALAGISSVTGVANAAGSRNVADSQSVATAALVADRCAESAWVGRFAGRLDVSAPLLLLPFHPRANACAGLQPCGPFQVADTPESDGSDRCRSAGPCPCGAAPRAASASCWDRDNGGRPCASG